MKDRIDVSPQTVAGTFLERVERCLNDDGPAMTGICEGRLLAAGSGGVSFRLAVGSRNASSGQLFANYLDLFDGMTAPVAIIWPMRQAGGIADSTAQSRYMAVCLKLATGERWGILDHNKRLEWHPATSPRVAQLRLCLNAFRPEQEGAGHGN